MIMPVETLLQMLNLALAWLVGNREEASPCSPCNGSPLHGETSTPPLCPHCAGTRKTAYVVHCSCGCGKTFESRGWCPLCGGVGAVPAAVASAARSRPGLQDLARLRAQPARN